MTTLPHSYADFLEIWEPQHPGTLKDYARLDRNCFTFTYTLSRKVTDGKNREDTGIAT